MSLVNQSQSKRLVAVHGWSGTLLGLFLYVIVLTGAVTVLAHEVGLWSASGKKVESPLEVGFHDRISELAASVNPEYLEETLIYPTASHSLLVFFHTHAVNDKGKMDDLGVRFVLDPRTLEIIEQHEGFASEMPSDNESALERFITTLHVNMHAPDPWGLFLTGILGFVMLIAAISGLILHKHLLKDLFIAPRYSSALLNKKDRHVLAGSWSLPFSFVLAFTGAFFSFAGAIGLPVVAMVSFGGDQEKMFETLVGTPQVVDERPAPSANLDRVVIDSLQRVGADPALLIVHHWGRADSEITIYNDPIKKDVKFSRHLYDGVTGDYKREMPTLGQEDSLGNELYNWMFPLHFGTFAGLMSKITWVALGLATCYVSLTGLQLWVQRRKDQPVWQKLSRLIPAFGFGTPVALVGGAIGYFIALPQGNAVSWTGWGFILSAILALMAACTIKSPQILSSLYRFSLGIGLLSLPLLRMVLGGIYWPELFASGNAMVIAMDLVFILGGGVTLALTLFRARGHLSSSEGSLEIMGATNE